MKINNCKNCSYKDRFDDALVCNRPIYSEHRTATNLGDIDLPCPCHSNQDQIKKEGGFIEDIAFQVSKEKLRELEAYIFAEAKKLEDIEIEDYEMDNDL